MHPDRPKVKDVDEYIQGFDGVPRQRVEQMRQLIRSILPSADERISYGIPAYFVEGKLIIYFAGYDNHIGMYPGRTNSDAYNKLAAQYAHGKSTAQFKHSDALPEDIIRDFIQTRLIEVGVSK